MTGKEKRNKQKKEKSVENKTSENIELKSKKRKTKDDNNETKPKNVKFTSETIDNEVEGSPKTKNKHDEQPEELAPLSAELEEEMHRPENIKNVASKRQQKREKHEKLIVENKQKCELKMQQKALNYLSLWKHNKQEWRFEKIKQIWIQTSMFDAARIPDEFWNTTVEYFGGSKGRIRHVLIENCMKIVDEEDKADDAKEKSEAEETKAKRARELLQHLQE